MVMNVKDRNDFRDNGNKNERINRPVYTRENKPRLILAVAYIICERNYLYE